MIKLKNKTGDIVRVIAGDHKGAEGKVRVDREKTKAIVEGVKWFQNIRNQVKSPQGGIVKKEASIQISNISLIDPKTKETTSWN
jgi:large subunit ribosomal protein L24